MKTQTKEALQWIAGVLNEQNIPYRVGGGTAVHLYGGGRSVNDIDISVSGKYFPAILPLVREHIVAGPKHYVNEKWDCNTLSLSYQGQDIDLTDVDTLQMRLKDGSGWVANKDIYGKHPDVTVEVDGTEVTLMHPRVLFEYKRELSGAHQEEDIAFLERYIEENNL